MTLSIQTEFVRGLPITNSPRKKCIVKAKRREWNFFKRRVGSFNRLFVRAKGCIRLSPLFFTQSENYRKSHARNVRLQLEDISTIREACRRHFRKSRSRKRRCRHISGMVGELLEASREMESLEGELGQKIAAPKYATCKHPIELKAHERLRRDVRHSYREHIIAKPTKNPKLVCLSVKDKYHYPMWPFGKGMRATELGKLHDWLAMPVPKHGGEVSVKTSYWWGWRTGDAEYASSSVDSVGTLCEYTAKTKGAKKACPDLLDELERKRKALVGKVKHDFMIWAIILGGALVLYIVSRIWRRIMRLIKKGGPRGPSDRGGGGGVGGSSNSRYIAQRAEDDEVMDAPFVVDALDGSLDGSSEYSIAARRLAEAQSYFNRRDVQIDVRGMFRANLPPRTLMKAPANKIFFMPMIRIAVPRIRANFKLRAAPRPRLQLRMR